jgi:predicted ATPase
VRLETNAVASQISAAILALYKEYGYEIIRVAPGSVEARVAFIEKRSEAI